MTDSQKEIEREPADMNTKQTRKQKKFFLLAGIIIGLCILTAILLVCLFPKNKRADLKRLSTECYDSVFLSMYPIDNFYEEDFTYWRGMTLVKADYNLPSFSSLKTYLNVIGKSGNTISTIYLGVLPEKLDPGKLAGLLQSYPGVHFEIILPNPSMDDWLALSEEQCERTLSAYEDFINTLLPYGNMSLYFFGASEWLIANPANYGEGLLTSEDTSLTIMLNSDRDHAYLLTEENSRKTLEQLSSLIDSYRLTPPSYPDASHMSIVFLGDSVIGNYTGPTSIPGVVEGLTHAQVFNLGNGGGSATKYAEEDCSLLDIVNTIIYKDMSYVTLDLEKPAGYHLNAELNNYFKADLQDELCFVISYGLNDYFCGALIASDDPYDPQTYAGSIRTSVEALKQAYPDARIILMTPNFTSYFGNGTDYRGDATHTLEDYVDTVISLADELQVELLDNYHDLGINAKNHGTYLLDGCHPNETGRFMIGSRIARKLAEQN